MSELGLVPTTEAAAFGPTHNPWAPGHSPGGSSGGSAVAVAAGVVPVAHAADGGGSIRIPASACGLIGLKPSRGRVPTWADDPPQGFVSHFAVTRSVRDTAALLDHLRVDRSSDPLSDVAARDPAPLKIGLTTEGFWGERLDRDVEAVLTRTAERLQVFGHAVEIVTPPVDAEPFARAFRVLWATAAGVFFESVHRDAPLPEWLRQLTRPPGLFRMLTALSGGSEAFTRRLARFEARLSPSDLWMAEQALLDASSRLDGFFEQRDLWLTATLTQPPPRHGALDLRVSDDGLKRAIFGLIGFTPVANATGVPAISIPAGQSTSGLPVGIQLIAPMGREDHLLAVTGQLERAHGWSPLPIDRAHDSGVTLGSERRDCTTTSPSP